MDDSIGVGLLFADGHSDDEDCHNRATSSNRVNRTRIQADLPNPYAASSSSDDDMEADLDQVETVRRSLLANKRTKKGWLAHQSVFPPSSSSSASESDKDTEPESDEGEMEPPSNLQEPLLGPDEMRGGPSTQIPVRLQVYHGRFAHWEREGLRKYKGGSKWRNELIPRLWGPGIMAHIMSRRSHRTHFRLGTYRVCSRRTKSISPISDPTPPSAHRPSHSTTHTSACVPVLSAPHRQTGPHGDLGRDTILPVSLWLVGFWRELRSRQPQCSGSVVGDYRSTPMCWVPVATVNRLWAPSMDPQKAYGANRRSCRGN
jgi:hypothetical protein